MGKSLNSPFSRPDTDEKRFDLLKRFKAWLDGVCTTTPLHVNKVYRSYIHPLTGVQVDTTSVIDTAWLHLIHPEGHGCTDRFWAWFKAFRGKEACCVYIQPRKTWNKQFTWTTQVLQDWWVSQVKQVSQIMGCHHISTFFLRLLWVTQVTQVTQIIGVWASELTGAKERRKRKSKSVSTRWFSDSFPRAVDFLKCQSPSF